MSQKEHLQAQDDDEISLVDILLFLKASCDNIVKSTLVSLLAGGVYYFAVPKMYEASADIEMATVADAPVQTPEVLLEKMKSPLYFSPATLQACGTDGGLSSQAKFVDKIKPSIKKNKPVPLVSFVIQAQSTQEAKACLNEAIADVSSKQDAIAKPLIDQKRQTLNALIEQLKIAEEIGKSLPQYIFNNNTNNTQSMASILVVMLRINAAEINDLRSKISSLQFELIEPKARPTSLFSPVYSPEASVNKRPLFILGLCLALGVFLGLLVTGIMRMVPGIRRQIREAESMVR